MTWERHRGLLVGLTAVAGTIDALSFLRLGKVFTSFQSGNVLFLGLGLGEGDGGLALRAAVVLLAFVAGTATGTRLAGWGLAAEAALLTAFAVVWLAVGTPGEDGAVARLVLLGLAGGAMGLQAAIALALRVSNVLTVALTATVAELGRRIGAGAPVRRSAGEPGPGLLGLLVATYLVCALTVALLPATPALALVPLALLLATTAAAGRRTRRLAPIALAGVVAMAAAVPAVASPGAPARAHAAGGDVVVLTYPSLVRSRVAATRRALKRATQQLEDGASARAVARLGVVRSKLASSWRGARYVIRTTPPPVADEAWIRPSGQASGDGPTGPTLAGPADTALLVLTLQHDVAAEMVDQLDDAPAGGVDALGTTLRYALAQRDRALRDIRAIAPPAPAQEDRARLHARASGDGPVVATFETVMPQVIPQLDDELQAIDGLRSDATGLTPAARGYLGAAAARIARTRATVKRLWPPIPAED